MLRVTPAIQISIKNDAPLALAFMRWLVETDSPVYQIGGGSSGLGNFQAVFHADFAPEIEAFLKQAQKRLRQEKRTAAGQ